jgi:hypothetical protein
MRSVANHRTHRRQPYQLLTTSSQRAQQGFTVIEFMIATFVFSTILIVVTTGVIYFTNGYYRGINSSTTQTTVRNATDIITQSIQFGSAQVVLPQNVADGSQNWFCAGGYIFTYKTGVLYRDGENSLEDRPGLYMRPMKDAACTRLAAADFIGGQQLLGNNMRVTHLSLKPQVGDELYELQLKIAYGEDDLLTATTGSTVQCRPGKGSQYCSVAEVMVSAQKRVQ